MCGRFYINENITGSVLQIAENIDASVDLGQAGDISPSQQVVVLFGKKAEICARSMDWGFPSPEENDSIINARGETVLEKKMFRDSVIKRRCVIPASGFYEWDKMKNKVKFDRYDNKILFMAGIYKLYGSGYRFVIITSNANSSVSDVHDRMPLILEESEIKNWLFDDEYIGFALGKASVKLRQIHDSEQMSFL